jgi:type 1 glutamine amidotransferase
VLLLEVMNLPRCLLPLGLGLLGLSFLTAGAAPLRVLYFTKSAGYEHSAIKRTDGQPSYSEKVLTVLGKAHDIDFTFSKDGSLFSPEYLAKFDVIMFYTTGDLTSVGTDGQPAMSPAGKQALLDAVAGGKGFVGLHCASDTFHTFEHGGGNPPPRENRYQNNGDKADPYIKMLGAEFIMHDAQQVSKAMVQDPSFPGCGALDNAIEVTEEWYTLKDFAPDMHVLLVLDTSAMTGPDYQRPSYPIAWARAYGKGRVWFDAMGHREDVWDNPKFQAMLLGGLDWAGGGGWGGRPPPTADIPPNLKTAAPGAYDLQKMPPPAAK